MRNILLSLIGVGLGALILESGFSVRFYELRFVRYSKSETALAHSPLSELALSQPNPNLANYILEKWGATSGRTALAVARAENGTMVCDRVNVNSNFTIDVGVFQINTVHFKRWPLTDLIDCYKNVDAAYVIWDRADGIEGDGKGNFSPWVAYWSGSYERFLN